MHEPPSQRYYYCQQFQNIVHNIFGAYYLRASFQFFFLHLEICSQTFLQFEWKIYVRETNPSWIRIFSGQREKSRYLILREEQQIDSQPATTPTWNHFANKLTSQQEERKNLNESWRIFNMYTAIEIRTFYTTILSAVRWILHSEKVHKCPQFLVSMCLKIDAQTRKMFKE